MSYIHWTPWHSRSHDGLINLNLCPVQVSASFFVFSFIYLFIFFLFKHFFSSSFFIIVIIIIITMQDTFRWGSRGTSLGEWEHNKKLGNILDKTKSDEKEFACYGAKEKNLLHKEWAFC